MQVPSALAVVRGLGFGELGLQRTQAAVAVDDEFGRRAVRARNVLRHMRDAPGSRQIEIARVGQQFATEQGEQGRFAAAVLAHQAHMLAWADLQLGAGKQKLRAAAQRELLKTDHGRFNLRTDSGNRLKEAGLA